jgi:hypothetical protein
MGRNLNNSTGHSKKTTKTPCGARGEIIEYGIGLHIPEETNVQV